MKSGLLTMSTQEIERLTIIKRIAEKQIKQRVGAKLLNLTARQIRRLVSAYRREGVEALISKHRGRKSNNRHDINIKEKTRQLIKLHYPDFGPTFAAEKLREQHELTVNKETIRQWMIEWKLWKTKRQKKATVHQSRERRACFGELVQIDGSPHDWFEGRAPKCCLLVFIDDATGRLLHLRFEPSETTAGYFRSIHAYLKEYGKPVAFYSDRHGIFRVNIPHVIEEAQTQFERAMETLEIEIICANSPQAKGRVERVNQTLQDRLVKELRLNNISSTEAGNAFLPGFTVKFNQHFAVEPASKVDAHRIHNLNDEMLEAILCFQYNRKLSKNLELSYNNVIYQIQTAGQGYTLRHATVTVREHLDGRITLCYKGRQLRYKTYHKKKKIAEIISAKQLNQKIENVITQNIKVKRYTGRKQKIDHPWRGCFRKKAEPVKQPGL
jgi:F0F1-type ATP synthase delta subunit